MHCILELDMHRTSSSSADQLYLNISYLQIPACNFCDWRRDNEDDPFPLPEAVWPTQQQMNVTNLMGITLHYPLEELSRLTEHYQRT